MPLFSQDKNEPIGYATQGGGTTGGGDAAPVTIHTLNELTSYISSENNTEPAVLYLSGTITVSDKIPFKASNKTLIGLPGAKLKSIGYEQSNSGIFSMSGAKNIIIRNIVFEGPGSHDVDGRDNLTIDNCKNVWIDHCEFIDGVDGNFDIKKASDYITVSWCKFSYTSKSVGHRYCNLIGHSDSQTSDDGHLLITFMFNWWAEGCVERLPRVRFGHVHVVNNYYSPGSANKLGITPGVSARIRAEKNHFYGVKNPLDDDSGKRDSKTCLEDIDNYFENCSGDQWSNGKSFTPPYTLDIIDKMEVKSVVTSCAGASLPSPAEASACAQGGNKKPFVSLSAPTDDAEFSAGADVEVTAEASDEDGTIAKVEFYRGGEFLGSDNSFPYSYNLQAVAEGAYSLTAVAYDNEGASSVSAVVRFVVNDPDKALLTVSGNTVQSVQPGDGISPIVFTWGGGATGVTYSALPEGLSASLDENSKTLTVIGTPAFSGSFTVTTTGGTSEAKAEGRVSVDETAVIADWYPFQEESVSLPFVSLTDASVIVDFYEDELKTNGVDYTAGAASLATATGYMTLSLTRLKELKLRMYNTGSRYIEVQYGKTGTENVWVSADKYAKGDHELDLTALIPDLVSEEPIRLRIINNSGNTGSIKIHDLYVKGAFDQPSVTQLISLTKGWNLFSINVQPTDNSLASIFGTADVAVVKTADGFWSADVPDFINTINTIEAGGGYLVYMNAAADLSISGKAVAEALPPIQSGWNIVGVPFQAEKDISSVLGNAQAVKSFNGLWTPTGIPSISKLMPGKAYFVKM